jgi:hypothetical protein
MPVKGLSQAEIDEATRAQVASGAKSTDRVNRLPGETATEANARITAAYKEMTAKPIISQEAKDAGAIVKFVRTAAGGVGENMVIVPIGYDGPPIKVTEFTPGVIPANVTRTTGTSVGFNPDDYKTAEDMQRIATKLASGQPLTIDEQAFLNKGVTPAISTTAKTYTDAELQAIVAKLGRGDTLTAEEKAAIGMGAATTTTATTTSTTTTPTTSTTKTPDQIAAYNNAKSLAQQFVDLYGGKLGDYFDEVTGKVTAPSKDVINKKFTPPTTTNPTTTTVTTNPTTTVVTTNPTTSVTSTIPAGVNAETAALIKSLQDQIAGLTKQVSANTTAATSATYNDRLSVYSSMADRFNKYGLTGLANKIKELAMQGATEATITLQLQETPEYQQRFAANADRLKKGLAALTPAEYVNVEDSYRQVLRAYGLKQFDNDAYVRQFIANDMSPTELSNRVVTAVQRVQNADPALISQLKQYYGIGATDMVGYVLDPEQQFQKIERQIAASEIGVAAGRQGLQAGVSVAEQLAAQGVTEAEARKGYATIADILPTAEKLSDIYGTTLDEYRQAEGEQEVFNSLASAQRKRQKLTAREIAAFSGASGTNRTSLTTSSVGQF